MIFSVHKCLSKTNSTWLMSNIVDEKNAYKKMTNAQEDDSKMLLKLYREVSL